MWLRRCVFSLTLVMSLEIFTARLHLCALAVVSMRRPGRIVMDASGDHEVAHHSLWVHKCAPYRLTKPRRSLSSSYAWWE